MAVRREVVSLSQLLQRHSMGASSNDKGPTPIVRPATPLVDQVSAGAIVSSKDRPVRPPPLRTVSSRPPVQRVRGVYDARSQQGPSYQNQSAHSAYSLSQEEDSCMPLSQPQYSQSQTYFTPSQDEPRGFHVRDATPTVQQSRYFQMMRESGRTASKPAERGDSQGDHTEKLLNPIKKTLDDINFALERQQGEQRRHRGESSKIKEQIEGLASAVDRLWKQHRETQDDCAEASVRSTSKMVSALSDIQHSLRKMQDHITRFTDSATQLAEQERATNRAILAALAGVHSSGGQSSQRHSLKRKATPSLSAVQLQRKRSRSHPAIGSPGQIPAASTPTEPDTVWVGSGGANGTGTSRPHEVIGNNLRSALKMLQDTRARHRR